MVFLGGGGGGGGFNQKHHNINDRLGTSYNVLLARLRLHWDLKNESNWILATCI